MRREVGPTEEYKVGDRTEFHGRRLVRSGRQSAPWRDEDEPCGPFFSDWEVRLAKCKVTRFDRSLSPTNKEQKP